MKRGAHVRRLVTLVALSLAVVLAPLRVAAEPVRLGYLDSQQNRRVLETLADAYQRNQPGESVSLVPLSSQEAQKLLPQWMYTGEKADVFFLPVEYIGAIKGRGLARPLDSLRWPGTPISERFADFPPGMQYAYSEGHLPIGIPLTANVQLFQYNGEMLKYAGLPPLAGFSQDWTWYDMIDAGRQVASPRLDRYFLDINLEFAAVYFLVHGDIISADARESKLYNDDNVKILRLAQEAIHRDGISPPPSEQRNEDGRFRSGQLALRQVSATEMHPARVARDRWQWPFDWDLAMWPRSPYSNGRPALGEGSGLVVASGARSRPEIARLLDFAASAEAQAALAHSAGVVPALPHALASAWQDADASKHYVFVSQVLQDWQFFTFPVTIIDDLEMLLGPIQAVLEGITQPEDGLKMTHKRFQAVLNQAAGER